MKKNTLLLAIICILLATGTGFSQAQQNNSLNFDGSNDHVDLIAHAGSFWTSNYTLEFWVYNRVQGTDTSEKYIFSMTRESPRGRFVSITPQTISHLYLKANGRPEFIKTSISGGTINKWIHVAVTHDGTTSKLYINGIEEGSSTITNSSFLPGAIRLGALSSIRSNEEGISSNFFKGDIDEFRYWNKALTAEEILAQKDCKIPVDRDGLVAYYDFNQGTAGGDNSTITTLTNRTRDGLHGTLNGLAKSGTTSNFAAGAVGAFDSDDANCYAAAVSTAMASNIASTSATLNGDITSDGGDAITGRGFVYSITNTDPEISGTDTDVTQELISGTATGTGAFTKNAIGLIAGTQYHYKAYAINGAGTSYGEVQSFTTQAQQNNSLNFDGSNDYIDLTAHAGTFNASNYTIEFWVYNRRTDNDFQHVFANTIDNPAGYLISVTPQAIIYKYTK